MKVEKGDQFHTEKIGRHRETKQRAKRRKKVSNREQRIEREFVHVLLALARPVHGEKAQCIRTVDKGIGDEVDRLEAILKFTGGYWRIHRTVNARDVEKARKVLLIQLINHPEMASYIDSQWRTALLQPECVFGDKKFMLDVDTNVKSEIHGVADCIESSGGTIVNMHDSPKGIHFITQPFDTRKVCELEYVTLIRDGYYFVREVGKQAIKDWEGK